MNNKNIIIVGIIAIGIYLFSQGKSIFSAAAPQTTGQRTTQKAAKKVDISKVPVRLLRLLIAHAAAQKKTGKEVAALKAEVARREAAWLVAHKAAQRAAARKAALRKAAVRKATAKKIGKKIGKTVAQKIPQILKARRAVIAQHAKRQRPRIQRPRQRKNR